MFGETLSKTDPPDVSDPDRLQQLRRQRAAIAGHLSWLDQEIKRGASLPVEPSADDLPPQVQPASPTPAQPDKLRLTQVTPSVPAQSTSVPAASNPSPALTADPDTVLEEWTETAGDQSSDQPMSKMGCWLIFAVIAVVGIGGVAAFIYLVYG